MAMIGSFLDGQFVVNVNFQDCIEWKLDKKRKFSVGSAMQCLLKPQLEVNWEKLVWSSSNVLKHSFIFWLAM